MKKYLAILLATFCVLASGQDIKKGYKSLAKSDYQKARDAFQKNLSEDRDNIGANFGMAIVLADDSSTYFNIIDAWEHIERIEGRTGDLLQEDIEILSEYFQASDIDKTSRPVKKKIANALEAIEARLIKYIREENNLEAVNEVLDRYPNFRHYDNVVHIRNQFEYRKYEKQNTGEAYEEFLQKFPDAAQVQKAIRSRNKIAFEETKSQNSVSAYSSYIQAFPESEYLQIAIKLRNAAAFENSKSINTLEAYENYIEAYPEALEVSEAKTRQRDLLYMQAKRIKSLQAFNDFIGKYPDGQYFVDIFNLKASELGTLFLRENNFTNPSILWSKGFDNNGYLESGGSTVITPDGNCVLACNTRANDSAYADVWVIKINPDGKMQWNKTVGQAFEDSVSNILVDSKGNVIVIGYTYLSADSASKKGWMFKLGNDGTKIWNKNLGDINVRSSAIDANDRIYIGGSVSRDSLGSFYSITTFNKDANRIGEKVYTGKGVVEDMIITPDGDIFLCGTNWLICMESKRYIKWEAVIDPELTATSCSRVSSGDFYVAGYNTGKIFYSRFSSDGNKLWLQSYDKSDSTQVISDISTNDINNLLVLEQKQGGAKMKLVSSNGDIMEVKEIFGDVKLENTINSGEGMFVVLSNGDLMVLKYSQLNAL